MADVNYYNHVLPRDIRKRFDGNTSISVLHLNIRSMKNKHDEIDNFICDLPFSFDCYMFTETWCLHESDLLSLPSFSVFFLNRPSRGGGVAIYVKSCYSYEIVPEFSAITNDYEALVLKNNNNILSVIYRPPAGNLAIFYKYLNNFLEFCSANCYTIVLGGDFNINVSETNVQSLEFNTIIECNGFVNIITSPTRITVSSLSTIDLLIVNTDTVVQCAGTLLSDLSDHCPVFAVLKKPRPSPTTHRPVTYRAITDTNLASFRRAISEVNWLECLTGKSVDDAYNCFIDKFTTLYDANFPWLAKRSSKKLKTLGFPSPPQND